MRIQRSNPLRRQPSLAGLAVILALGLMILVVLTSGPSAWATERQNARYQTIPPSVPITMSVTLQRPNAPPPDPSWAVPIRLTLHPPGDPDTILHGWNLTLDQWGNWSGRLVLEPGQFDVRLKNMHTLRNVRRNVEIIGPTTIDVGELHEGDADNDNRVRITDFGILRSAYFTDAGDPDFDPRADFDEDDRIRITDFALLRMNYFQDGDIEVTLAGQSTAQRLDTVDVYVAPSALAVTAGDLFTVTVMVSAGTQDVVGAEFDLRFDPAFLQVVDTTGQPATGIEPAGPLTELANRVDPAAGRIRYGAGTFDVVSGTFPLAIVRCKALASTQATPLHFADADVVAPGGESVVGELGDGTVSIHEILWRYLPLLLRSR